MVSKEVAFAESLQRIMRTAREQGNCVSEEQVKEEFEDLEFNDNQLQMVYDYLENHKIGIGEPGDPDAGLTEEERNYLQNYLDGLDALPVYSDGEKRAYTMSVMAGDRMAAGRLTECYLKDVVDIARLYTGQGVLLEDLIGEGNVALAMGVELLATGVAADAGMLSGAEGQGGAERGIEDAAFGRASDPAEAEGMLVRSIMDAMEALIRESTAIEKESKKVAARVNKVADRARELAEEFHRKVTPQELVRETGMSMESIQDAMRMSGFQIEDIAYDKERL